MQMIRHRQATAVSLMLDKTMEFYFVPAALVGTLLILFIEYSF